MRRTMTVMALTLLVAGFAAGQARRFQFSLFGGLDRVSAYGADGEYVMGSNDFPVTPAHTPMLFGASLAYSLSGRLSLELRAEYALAANLNLTDPSDLDTVSIPSAKHLAFSLNLMWTVGSGRLQPYVVAGGGADKLLSSAASVISDYGYEVTFAAPVRTLDFFLHGGAGLKWNFSSSLGLFLEGRYRHLFASPHAIRGLIGAAGLSLRF